MVSSKVGPSGGMSGEPFQDDLIADNERVTAVKIRAGIFIDGIQLVVEGGTSTRELAAHGGNGGTERTVFLDDDEFVTEVSGRYGIFVDSIAIRTNKNTLHKFGGDGGQADYIYQAPEGFEIVGFHGQEGNILPDSPLTAVLDSIGLGDLDETISFIVAIGVILRRRK